MEELIQSKQYEGLKDSLNVSRKMLVKEKRNLEFDLTLAERSLRKIEGKKGIFVAERNSRSFLEKVSYIMNNYESIQRDMKENTLPTKSDFLKEISKLISNFN